uniref:Sodium/nucleoside cotransporter n=1 Tax=Romanomermis culicivorax TaxID=13658 RepID=A0A915JJD6_ROMCU
MTINTETFQCEDILPTYAAASTIAAASVTEKPRPPQASCCQKWGWFVGQLMPFIKRIFLVVLFLGYLAYLGYALHLDVNRAKPLVIFTAIILSGLVYYKIVSPLCGKRKTSGKVCSSLPRLLRRSGGNTSLQFLFPAATFVAIAVFLAIDTANNRRRLIPLGAIGSLIVLSCIFSTNPASIPWRTVYWGFFLQFLMGVLSLKWQMGLNAFGWLSENIVHFLEYTDYGTKFVYGFLVDPPNICGVGPIFVFKVLQVIIFFGSVVAVLYYFGIIQFVLSRLAKILQWTMGTNATESFYAVGCIVLGQSEAPILITPYLPKMTTSEFNTIMTTGFSCIAGSVFAAYVSLGACPFYILSACIMSAPASIAVSKILRPESEESQLKNVSDLKLPKSKEQNFIEAISSGATSVVIVVASITANLIVFLAFLYFIDDVAKYLASLAGLNIGFQVKRSSMMISHTEWEAKTNETLLVAQLMGTKTVLNEFIAYEHLGKLIAAGELTERAYMMATYALCSFSNFCSIGVQMGILNALCPEKKGVVAKTILRALVGGCICCIITSCVAGILVVDTHSCPPRLSSTNCTII